MRVTAHSASRILGYVHVHVASRVYVLPVESRSLKLDDGSVLEPGLFEEDAGRYGIRVDRDAPESAVRDTIEQASAEAARRFSRKLLN
ncbi:MAG: hypothetical protein ABSC94_16700 [Polyangiaceae bacterium]|jgi:hypothetical protein